MSLPNVMTVRQRIEAVSDEPMRYCLMALYLFAARVSEVVSKAFRSDNTVARGPRGDEVRLDTFQLGEYAARCAVFTVRTAKRQGRERLIALPLDEQYEPWAGLLYGYYTRAEAKPVFPFSRQQVWKYVKDQHVFDGLTYPIERYKIVNKTKDLVKEVDKHRRDFRLHALRHLRATELVEFYGFDGFNLSIFGGWTFRSMVGVSGMFDRYLSLSWFNYFPKLLKSRIQNEKIWNSD